MSNRAWLVLASASLLACGAPAQPPAVAKGFVAMPPSTWEAPPYTPAQEALLAPVGHPVQVPAKRVLPDLARFSYATNHVVETAEEAVKLTRLVATVLNDSPHFYSLDHAAPELANEVVQYGPPGRSEPDGWALPGGDGLVPAPFVVASREAFAKGEADARTKSYRAAVDEYAKAILWSPRVPAIRVAMADALASAGRGAEAEKVLHEAVAVDPTYAPAHVVLAVLAAEKGVMSEARREIAEALSYAPTSTSAADVAVKLGAPRGRLLATRADPIPIFLDVDAVGAVHVATNGDAPREMYAGCRAIMRYEPDLRAEIFDEDKDAPYHLSLAEEVICLEAAIGAYVIDRRDGSSKDDAQMDALIEIASEEGLAGYAMFEILGRHRPERARAAPADVHRAMVRYVERHVLGEQEMPEGEYTASR